MDTFLSLKPGVGQNIAMHASPSARNLSPFFIFNLPSPFTVTFFKYFFYFLTALILVNAVSRVVL